MRWQLTVFVFDGGRIGFKEISDQKFRADKLSETGAVYYDIWADELGREYIQIVDNVGGYGQGVGTFSGDIYPLDNSYYSPPISGYDPVTGAPRSTSDNNMSAFLRAARNDFNRRREGDNDK
jgi:hypothetical protein